jgi:hypothetical protein
VASDDFPIEPEFPVTRRFSGFRRGLETLSFEVLNFEAASNAAAYNP